MGGIMSDTTHPSEPIVGHVQVFSLTQAAAMLGVQHDTLRTQARRGALAATRVGTQWVVTQQAIDGYARERRGKRGIASPAHPLAAARARQRDADERQTTRQAARRSRTGNDVPITAEECAVLVARELASVPDYAPELVRDAIVQCLVHAGLNRRAVRTRLRAITAFSTPHRRYLVLHLTSGNRQSQRSAYRDITGRRYPDDACVWWLDCAANLTREDDPEDALISALVSFMALCANEIAGPITVPLTAPGVEDAAWVERVRDALRSQPPRVT
jgi:excisionase family DNA binding protein